jgi:hypothetical protein
MRVPRVVLKFLQSRLLPIPTLRVPDEIIGPGVRSRKRDGHIPVDKAFLHRWFLLPKNKFCNIYLHNFTRDDEDRALHDHPWFNLSVLLKGQYIEHTIDAGGVHRRTVLNAGDLKFRAPWDAHRVECIKEYDEGGALRPIPCWSLFITGPVQHGWGFHCPGEWTSRDKFSEQGGCADADYAPDGNLRGYKHRDIIKEASK